MIILAQIIGLIASIVMILGIQVKEKKYICLIFIVAKIFYGINFALLSAYSGAINQIIGLVITVVSYIYTKRNKKIPLWISSVFIIITLIGGFFTYSNIYSLLAIGAGITYALIVASNDMKTIRKLNLIQALLWTIYDLIISAYTASISSVFVFVSTLIAIFRYDILKKDKIK